MEGKTGRWDGLGWGWEKRKGRTGDRVEGRKRVEGRGEGEAVFGMGRWAEGTRGTRGGEGGKRQNSCLRLGREWAVVVVVRAGGGITTTTTTAKTPKRSCCSATFLTCTPQAAPLIPGNHLQEEEEEVTGREGDEDE